MAVKDRIKARPATQEQEDEHGIGDEIRRLHKIQALLIAVQFAANHEADFDVSDAVAAIILLVEQVLDQLDQLDVSGGGEE